VSHPLEPGRRDMVQMGQAAVKFVADFIGGLDEAPAVNLTVDEGTVGERTADNLSAGDPAASVTAARELRREMARPPAEGPGDLGPLLSSVAAAASQAVETAGPRYAAYIPGGGVFTSALAELVARSLNRYTGLSGLAPGLVAMEESVIQWLCRQFGLPGSAGGLVTTGGSMATLSAVVAARHQRLGERIADGTVYVTAHTHHCVAKAARIAGLPARSVRTVPCTDDLRMDAGAAARMIERDRAQGRLPFLLVANAGTTDTGTVDPVAELGSLARREDLWFHVDAAYGGFFQLTERGRAVLSGIEQADSIVLDPHKSLFLPYGTGILLVRDLAPLAAAHSGEGHYLQDLDADRILSDYALPDYSALGLELTREFRGLRLWLPLHLHGVAAFRDALDEKLDLAAHAYQDLAADARLELPWEPDLSTVVFRLRGGDDTANRRLLDDINATGKAFLSSTRVQDKVTLRLCILSHRTHREHLVAMLQATHAAIPG
jgi:aromatic-L-amino-acid/L-tryptophan decarboxylase